MFDVQELVVGSESINQLFSEKRIILDHSMPVNGYLILKSGTNSSHSALVKHLGENNYVAISNKQQVMGLHSKDVRQTVYIDSLFDDKVELVCATGPAGSGKSTLALAYALDAYQKQNRTICLSKPAYLVGRSKAFGAVPGTIADKYAPYLMSYQIILEKLLTESGTSYLEAMKKKEHLKYIPIELTRGCTFENCTLILDEVQSLDWHELNTIVSRMGENSKMILLGDLNQIDTNLQAHQTGIAKLMNSKTFYESRICSGIKLTTQYRSRICELINTVDLELKDSQ